ncbi:MAG: HAD-IIB family hydrolase [candidate division Zixibacteria bacterium]|nr:HAD-IIB family hydrolase [candidate division Zixibacteria bacterium]MBU1471319.1 HAD-IIB family hydrolase [candidate division Zixibacteria bacterium]MBU2625808.1 HAD-IIB family hydrolase [candidate division Zixibacteria bacterium]
MTYTISDSNLDKSSLAVITDLDGTLLDYDSYSFDAAKPALSKLRAMKVPVICCSSKTCEEIMHWRRILRISDPFVSENGASVVLPRQHFKVLSNDLQPRGAYLVKTFGTNRDLLRYVFEKVRDESGITMIGFSDMTVAEIRQLCGFASDSEAVRAASREHSEPFRFGNGVGEAKIARVLREFTNAGLHVIRGRRFYHLAGKVNKGLAVGYLREAYLKAHGKRLTLIGIGDSKNDIEMLEAVDIPFLVMGRSRRYDKTVKETARPMLAGAPGPEGWNRAVDLILSRLTA